MTTGIITTQARAIRVESCRCGTDSLQTLVLAGTRSRLQRYVCRDCRRIGVWAVSAERAAKNWNAENAAARRVAE